ncbi:MAG: class I SAM-dependent methyltransferase [Patescibacteria group bacterium]|jgi:ubiquinone/menaquinone biosynthesis C-methylase UbiE
MENKFWNNYTKYKGPTSFPMGILEKYAKGNILDLGCGDGTHAGMVRKFFLGSIYAIDPSDDIIAKAKSRYQDINFQPASAYDLPYEDSFFDLVYAIDVIEHLKTPEKMLKEVERVLKSGGIVVFQTPNYPIKRLYDFNNFLAKKNWRHNFKDDPTHFYKFTAKHLKNMCSKYFEVVEFKTRNIFLQNKLKFLKNKRNKMPWILFGQKTIIILKK